MADKHRASRQSPLDREIEVIKRIQADEPLASVARSMNMSGVTIGKILRRNDIAYRPPRPRKLTPAQRLEALRMYAAGDSSYAIALRYEVKSDTITKAIRDAVTAYVRGL